jgi:dipeptidyl aminopeptidase/acylaminoacyl peptidase
MNLKKIIIGIGLGLIILGGGVILKVKPQWVDPRGSKVSEESRPLEAYDFDNLKTRGGVRGEWEYLGPAKAIESKRKAEGNSDIKVETKEFRFKSNGKWISGVINIPLTPMSNKIPAIIMIRGYADKEGYYPGSGSWRVADKLAEAGYVTVSVDFLGFADSDPESTDMLEARFEKVPNVLDLIETVKGLDIVDPQRIGIWAHSNGGQIALSVLEITGEKYPTVLWAPMTNPFPQSVLETTDDDPNSPVRKAMSEFLRVYDPRRYAFENYYQWIGAPVEIIQGTADVWCKVEWQEKVVQALKDLGREAKLSIFSGNDHNLSRDWDEAVLQTISWYIKYL